jgi:2-dehydro-3-deoxygluconokinase
MTADAAVTPAVVTPAVVTLGETMALFTTPRVGLMRHATHLDLGAAGAESNLAIGVRRLGVPAVWIGRVGDDEFGRMVLARVTGEGVDTSRAVVDAAAPTGLMFKERRSATTTRVMYYRAGSAGSRLAPSDIDEAVVRGAGALHVTGITPALSASARDAVRVAVAVAREAGVPVSLDLNYRRALWTPGEAGAELAALVALADVVFATDDEAALVVDASGPVGYAKALAGMGPGEVLVKRGAQGAVGWLDDEIVQAPPHAVECVDPVGAGDAFAAAYLAERVAGRAPAQCLAAAAIAGAFAVTVPGDWEGLPTREELEAFGGDTDVHR